MFSLDFSFLQEYMPYLAQAAGVTFILAFIGIAGGLLLGFLLAKLRVLRIAPLNWLVVAYSEIICGIPFLVLALFFYYVVLPYDYYFLPYGDDKLMTGIIIIIISSSAYFADIIARGGQCLIFPLARQALQSFKDTSILSIIGIYEIVSTVNRIASEQFRPFETFIFLVIFYLCLTVPPSLLLRYFESKKRS